MFSLCRIQEMPSSWGYWALFLSVTAEGLHLGVVIQVDV